MPPIVDTPAFLRDGYLIARGLLTDAETDLLSRVAHADRAMSESAYGRKDAQGLPVTLALRNDLADDIYGAIARSRKVAGSMESLLSGEVYHYHHKLILKEPRVGGAWEWHQDYGYWYHNGCVFPYMASVMVALDHSTRENGCLQVLRGSHRGPAGDPGFHGCSYPGATRGSVSMCPAYRSVRFTSK